MYMSSEMGSLVRELRAKCEGGKVSVLTGAHGCGKTTLAKHALTGLRGFSAVEVCSIVRHRLTAGHLLDALADDLTGTAPFGSLERRSRYVRDALYDLHDRGQRAVLLLDDADEVPTLTLSDLARAHALAPPVLSILILGSSRLAARIQGDVRLGSLRTRAHMSEFPPIDPGGYIEYRTSLGDRAFARMAADGIEELRTHLSAPTFSEIDRTVVRACRHADRIREDEITAELLALSMRRAA